MDTKHANLFPRCLLAVVASLVLCAPPSLASGGDTPWRTVSAVGVVERQDPELTAEQWQRVRRGDSLAASTTMRTGARGQATLTRGASILIVDPDTQLELPAEAEGSTVIQRSGTVLYEVNDAQASGFHVVTPYLVAGVKGTVFAVSVSQGDASVVVHEGVVEVTSRETGESLDVHAGEEAVLASKPAARLERHDAQGHGADRSRRLDALNHAREVVRGDTGRPDHGGDPDHAGFDPGRDSAGLRHDDVFGDMDHGLGVDPFGDAFENGNDRPGNDLGPGGFEDDDVGQGDGHQPQGDSQVNDPPDQGGDPPGQGDDPPGQGDDPPGQGDDPPGQNDTTAVAEGLATETLRAGGETADAGLRFEPLDPADRSGSLESLDEPRGPLARPARERDGGAGSDRPARSGRSG